MEKTAIELLIEQIKSKADSLPYNTKENRIAKGIYVDCLMMAKQARGMEEQQIIDANIANPNVCKTTNWIKGYTQCQEDNADKKYTEDDIYMAIEFGRSHSSMTDRDFINSLNQD